MAGNNSQPGSLQMSQILRYWHSEIEVQCQLPEADAEVVPGVVWGDPCTLFTPAYWLSQLWMSGMDQAAHTPYRAHGTVHEELVFCMLGGYGITVELATAAFHECRDAGLIERLEPDEALWSKQLQQLLLVNGKLQRYRYPNQKARFLAGAMRFLHDYPLESLGGKALRDALLLIKGVGPKTAGWVARNCLDCDEVAILDIHLVRAGQLCNLFSMNQRVERDYFTMETRFIEFCHALAARPAVLDCLIWDQMRGYGALALNALREKSALELSSVRKVQPVQRRLSISV